MFGQSVEVSRNNTKLTTAVKAKEFRTLERENGVMPLQVANPLDRDQLALPPITDFRSPLSSQRSSNKT